MVFTVCARSHRYPSPLGHRQPARDAHTVRDDHATCQLHLTRHPHAACDAIVATRPQPTRHCHAIRHPHLTSSHSTPPPRVPPFPPLAPSPRGTVTPSDTPPSPAPTPPPASSTPRITPPPSA